MLSFSDFTKRLAHGQLKNTSAVNDDFKDQIESSYEDTILSLTNQGLVDISGRFPIITKLIDLVFVEDINLYKFHSDNVSSYLDETETDKFENDFLKIIDIYDSKGKRHTHDTNGHIMTPTYDSVRFTKSKIEELKPKVRIRYQAKHPIITADDFIIIPPNLETALQLFVASLFISHMNGSDHTVKGDSYFAAYLKHMGEDQNRNDSSTSEVDNDTRFCDRGFV